MELSWKRKMDDRIRVLVRGWTGPPHSYAIVNCFQLEALHRLYQDKLDIFIEEMPYFRDHWKKAENLYPETISKTINNLKTWNGEDVDIVYSITYPYDITYLTQNGKIVPKCVFYTSEFSKLDATYFKCEQYKSTLSFDMVKKIVSDNKLRLYFTSPSTWSSSGLSGIIGDNKNVIISHGVDTRIFHKDISHRQTIRNKFGVKDNEILMINIGAMTSNKGIVLIIKALHQLVNRLRKKQYKLLLKGSGDLYTSKQFLQSYLNQLVHNGDMTSEELQSLLKDHIIFTDGTLSFTDINALFNAADIYVSPYLAEGFNLTVLEALACGLQVVVSKTGSTEDYISNIIQNGGDNHIRLVESIITTLDDGKKQNVIRELDVVKAIMNCETNRKYLDDAYNELHNYIKNNYSWDNAANQLFDYFCEIHNSM